MPLGKLDVLIVKAPAAPTERLRFLEASCPLLSRAPKVKPKLPAVVGVPESVPVVLNVTPAGSWPLIKDQV